MIGLREPSRVSHEIQIFSANYHQSYFQTAGIPISLARTIFFTGSKWISPLEIHIRVWGGDIRPYLIGSSPFTASTTLKMDKNGPFWPLLAALACFTTCGPFFWLDLSGYHHWTFTLGCVEVISGHISLDPALLQPLQPSKRAKMAPFGCSGLFDNRMTIFWTGSKWISPLDIHIRVWGGDIRPYLIGSSPFTPYTTLKTGQNGPFWLLWLVWQPVDHFFYWI